MEPTNGNSKLAADFQQSYSDPPSRYWSKTSIFIQILVMIRGLEPDGQPVLVSYCHDSFARVLTADISMREELHQRQPRCTISAKRQLSVDFSLSGCDSNSTVIWSLRQCRLGLRT